MEKLKKYVIDISFAALFLGSATAFDAMAADNDGDVAVTASETTTYESVKQEQPSDHIANDLNKRAADSYRTKTITYTTTDTSNTDTLTKCH